MNSAMGVPDRALRPTWVGTLGDYQTIDRGSFKEGKRLQGGGFKGMSPSVVARPLFV